MFQDGINEITSVLCSVKRILAQAESINRSVAFQHIDGKSHAFASAELVGIQVKFNDALLAHTSFDSLECVLIQLDIVEVQRSKAFAQLNRIGELRISPSFSRCRPSTREVSARVSALRSSTRWSMSLFRSANEKLAGTTASESSLSPG
mmetsp:Transcript_18051/g.41482  ORF Transcript_18051/g.41482 Transcript_18051/m.41482 type:complete len:149 (+) Transcript_18051:606-1052(+)